MRFEKTSAKQLKQKLKAKAIFGLALDIDDTLSYTDRHYFEAMTKLINPEYFTADKIAAKYKQFDKVPYWRSTYAKKFSCGYSAY